MFSDPKRAVIDSLVGMPFVLLPGKPADHKVMGHTRDGSIKVRAAAVQTVWNDMLLMDAIDGAGSYAGRAGEFELKVLELAEEFYGVSAADGLKRWLTLPKLKRGDPLVEWPREAVN